MKNAVTTSMRTGTDTLSASPQHAQLLTHAQQHGILTLVLRNHDDLVHLKQLPPSGSKELQRVHAPPSLYRQIEL